MRSAIELIDPFQRQNVDVVVRERVCYDGFPAKPGHRASHWHHHHSQIATSITTTTTIAETREKLTWNRYAP